MISSSTHNLGVNEMFILWEKDLWKRQVNTAYSEIGVSEPNYELDL